MNSFQKKLIFYKQQAENLPKNISKIVRDTVVENVSDYLDTLNDVSEGEELKMLERKPRQSDLNTNKNYRDRVNSFKDLNRQVKQETGQEILDEESLGVPLKTALIDDSILQLYKMANEIALLIKSGKIDGPSLAILVEKAIDNVTKKASTHEVKDMLSELVAQVEVTYGKLIMQDLEKEKENFFKGIVASVNKISIRSK
jgi:hypothetical protein